MKVQFLTERYLRYAFLGCLLLEAGIFCLWNALDVEPYRQPERMNLEHAPSDSV